MTLLRASRSINPNFTTDEQATALSIFKRALEAPFRTMSKNSGLSEEVSMLRVENAEEWQGIDFSSGNLTNLKDVGVLDPAKVTRCAVKNAVSVAGTLLLTNHSIVQG